MSTDELRPLGYNHIATQTFDMAATHHFWTEIMGCEYVGGLRFGPRTVSTGETVPPFIHTFYALADGSCIAFFELASSPEKRDDGLPDWTRHIAMSVQSHEELLAWRTRLEAAGIDVAGEVDHDGLWHSIYLIDPNDIRIELTYQTRPLGAADHEEGVENLQSWLADKARGALI